MERITATELIEGRMLIIPDIDDVLFAEDMFNGHRFKDCGGVYIYFNKHHEPLYVGISHNLGKRAVEHVGSLKGNKDLVQYIASHSLVYCVVFHEPTKALQELYESYLILTLQPRYNISKTDRERLSQYRQPF